MAEGALVTAQEMVPPEAGQKGWHRGKLLPSLCGRIFFTSAQEMDKIMHGIPKMSGICRWDWATEGQGCRFSRPQAVEKVSSVAEGGSLAVLPDGEVVA